jgi:two-component system sensor histidine kinase PilS (NtrC family)
MSIIENNLSSDPGADSNPDNHLQDLTLVKIYTLYRVILAIALLATFYLSPISKPLVGSIKPLQFLYCSSLYLVFNLLLLAVILPKKTPFKSPQLFANFLFDIVAIIIIIDASSGVSSGLGLLLLIIIAASSILLKGQLAIVTAAIASIAIIGDTARLIGEDHLAIASFLPAGLLGITFFFTAILIQYLAARIRGSQVLAEQRALDVSKLQSLNQSIVQRMRTGILVVGEQGDIQLANAAASELLADPGLRTAGHGSRHVELSELMMDRFKRWQQTPYYQNPPFRVSETGPEINASFSALDDKGSTDTLIFLEDNRRLAQKAQQMKLASLGRLTASIAHEIRNPLGAVSHASQLLAESEALAETDQRLCKIIKKQSDRMNSVIENVLQLSSRNAPNPQRLLLDDWLQQFIAEFDFSDQQADIRLTASQPCEISFDSSQLHQVVTNLADNGLRYSLQHSGKASLQLDIHINPATELTVLDIIDDGPGVADDARENLFEPFYTTESKGSGLGLYIARELCEANEARLDYCRTEQQKSCFRISFPHPDRRLSPE